MKRMSLVMLNVVSMGEWYLGRVRYDSRVNLPDGDLVPLSLAVPL